MSIQKRIFTFFLCLTIATGITHAQTIDIKLSKAWEIGKEDLLFGSIAAVCEDSDGNFYVVDQIEAAIHKFSPEGKLLLSFGQKGQGPGDFQRPHRIAFTSKGTLAIADEMYYVSFLNTDGKFIHRVHLNEALTPGYVGEDHFYAWRWQPEGQQQILMDSEGSIVKTLHTLHRDQFSISIPDETGRQVMFNFGRPAFAPALLYAQNREHTAIAISDSYRIQILDETGNTLNTITHESSRSDLSKKEHEYFEEHFQELGKRRGWPQRAVRDILKKIPDQKVFFDRILLTSDYVFVFRIAEDVSLESSPVSVEIFELNGRFLGQTRLPAKPIFLSAQRMYFVNSDNEGNIYLTIRDYTIAH
jgi:hypothetical protein